MIKTFREYIVSLDKSHYKAGAEARTFRENQVSILASDAHAVPYEDTSDENIQG